MKDQNLYSEALKLYPSSTQEYKVRKLVTVSKLDIPLCMCLDLLSTFHEGRNETAATCVQVLLVIVIPVLSETLF